MNRESLRIAVVLENIRSAQNVGSIFRTADAAGVSKIVLIGYSPSPIDRFGRPQKDILKTALGAETTVPWEYFETTTEALAVLRGEGYSIAGVEIDDRAVDFRTFKNEGPVAYILGNEVSGVEASTRDSCDTLIQIPMHGTKESLNVAVAAGIILFV